MESSPPTGEEPTWATDFPVCVMLDPIDQQAPSIPAEESGLKVTPKDWFNPKSAWIQLIQVTEKLPCSSNQNSLLPAQSSNSKPLLLCSQHCTFHVYTPEYSTNHARIKGLRSHDSCSPSLGTVTIKAQLQNLHFATLTFSKL